MPAQDEYVANGAARVLFGDRAGAPAWPLEEELGTVEPAAGGGTVVDRYAEARSHVLDRVPQVTGRRPTPSV